eukprot:1419285-Prymnesium_polylepis.1
MLTVARHSAHRRAGSHHPPACDVLSIDSGHSFDETASHLLHLHALAASRHVLVVDDVKCPARSRCHASTLAWDDARRRGLVSQGGCRVLDGCCVGWCWGAFNASNRVTFLTPRPLRQV